MASDPAPSTVRRIGSDWEVLAQNDPLWAVLTQPDRKGNRWDPDEFFATGRGEIDTLWQTLERLDRLPDAVPDEAGRLLGALDFGCGVGRLSQALALRFERVVGVDISPTMIEQARAFANRLGPPADRCDFRVGPSDRVEVPGDERFAFAYSNIVFQHMPWSMASGYIGAIAERLAPGGLFAFQIPVAEHPPADGPAWKRAARTVLPEPAKRAIRRVRCGADVARMRMVATPEPVVRARLDACGLRDVAVADWPMTGERFDSRLFVARRPPGL
ncbi:MAG: class I SAM-dependent methyltransferase [Planctomycetota bacterium]